MLLGALGDIHGAFADARRIVARHTDVPAWLCVGDIASDDGGYESMGAPIYWIHGNNDNFDAIAANDAAGGFASRRKRDGAVGRGFVYRRSGRHLCAEWYQSPAGALPHPVKGTPKATALADKRRHFVREQVDACTRMRGIDVFLTHEAAKPFRAFANDRGPDAGKEQINEVSGRCSRACISSDTIIDSRNRSARVCGRSDWISSAGLYLLIDTRTLEDNNDPCRPGCPYLIFDASWTSACSSATGRWVRCWTRAASS